MLGNIAELENLVENHKQKLVNECKDYNTIDAFRLIDESGQGNVDQQDVINFLTQNFGDEMEITQEDLYLFIQRFDKAERQTIKYSEFCTAFAPLNAASQRRLAERMPQNTQLE